MPSRILRLWNPDVAAWEEVGDSRLTVHLAAADPHPQYLTAAEGSGAYLPLAGGTLTGLLTLRGASTTANVLQAQVAADTQPRFRANTSGTLEWGAGGSTAPNVSLFRTGSSLELGNRLIISGASTSLQIAGAGGFVEVAAAGSPAQSGALRLRNAASGAIAWRNAGNSADLALTVDASNQLTFNGVPIGAGGAYLPLAGGELTGDLVVSEATPTVSLKLTADTQPRSRLTDTALAFGPGGATAPDATLSRTGVGALRADKYLGVGATPVAWAASEPGVVQVGTSAHREGSLSFNTYYDGTTNRAIATGAALTMSSQSGQFYFYNAPSVAAGAAQTFTQRLLVSAAGTLTVSPDAGQPALLAGGTVTAAAGTNLALTSQGGNNVVVDPAGNVFAPNRNNAISNGAATLLWTVVYATQGTISTSSREAKEDITPLDPALALEAVRSTPAVTFTYNAPERPPEWYELPDDPEQAQQVLEHRLTAAPLEAAARQQAGFVAEDAHSLFLTGQGQTTPGNSVGVLLAALQELDRRLTALEGA